MGNIQQHCRGVTNDLLELDRPGAIYLPNDTITGSVLYNRKMNASILLTGVIYFKKRKRNHLKKCQRQFFSTEFNLNSSSNIKQNFQLHLDEHLPPSFNDIYTYPNITYSINLLIYKKSKDEILSSMPICVCPHVYIDRPLLLTPLFFGPIENRISGVKLEVKINRTIYTFGDIIQIFYEIQNPNQEYIYNIQISLGIYYVIESNVSQKDLCNSTENFTNIASNKKLIRNKALINIPNEIYLPPTFKFQYGPENDASSFYLEIDYKIHFKVYLQNMENLWQVDVPIIICNDTIEQTENVKEDNSNKMDSAEEENNNKTEIISQSFNVNTNIVENK
ncbi:unnamed protein product [Rotaria sp. Silwood2]|nr:unnamed protein product [Rotaria sp. Silwood2]